MLEIFWESPGCDTEKWANAVGKKGTNAGVATNSQFVKKKKKKQYPQSSIKHAMPYFKNSDAYKLQIQLCYLFHWFMNRL